MASHPGIVVTALAWNLFHGRDHSPERRLHTWRSRLLRTTERGEGHAQVNRVLRDEFAGLLDSWRWEVALLQEAPPRWLPELGRRCRANGVSALTSRNLAAPLRAAAAELNPDLIASNEGGSNMVLVRAPARIVAVERMTLALMPERRRLLLARVELPAGRRLAVACMHLSVPETGRSAVEVLRAAERAVDFAGGDPLVFGGDLNLRQAEEPGAFAQLEERFGLAPPTAPRAIDHLMGRGLELVQRPRALPSAKRELTEPDGLRIRLSDHAPVTAAFGMR